MLLLFVSQLDISTSIEIKKMHLVQNIAIIYQLMGFIVNCCSCRPVPQVCKSPYTK